MYENRPCRGPKRAKQALFGTEGGETMQTNGTVFETEGKETIVLTEETGKKGTKVIVRAPSRGEEGLWENVRREAAAVFLRRLQR